MFNWSNIKLYKFALTIYLYILKIFIYLIYSLFFVKKITQRSVFLFCGKFFNIFIVLYLVFNDRIFLMLF